MVATVLAELARERVGRIVLCSAAVRGLSFARAGVRGLRFAPCLARAEDMVETCLARRILSARFAREHPQKMERVLALLARTPTPRRVLLAHAVAGVRHDGASILPRLACPVLVIAGGEDTVLGRGAARAVAARCADARLVVLPGAGHDVTIEAPQETAELVSDFLDDEDRASAHAPPPPAT
jgi:pimeloyl-ACP methyl ester carboxylesterase